MKSKFYKPSLANWVDKPSLQLTYYSNEILKVKQNVNSNLKTLDIILFTFKTKPMLGVLPDGLDYRYFSLD